MLNFSLLIVTIMAISVCVNNTVLLLYMLLFKSCFGSATGFPVAQMVEHGTSNAKIMGSIPRESKSW